MSTKPLGSRNAPNQNVVRKSVPPDPGALKALEKAFACKLGSVDPSRWQSFLTEAVTGRLRTDGGAILPPFETYALLERADVSKEDIVDLAIASATELSALYRGQPDRYGSVASDALEATLGAIKALGQIRSEKALHFLSGFLIEEIESLQMSADRQLDWGNITSPESSNLIYSAASKLRGALEQVGCPPGLSDRYRARLEQAMERRMAPEYPGRIDLTAHSTTQLNFVLKRMGGERQFLSVDHYLRKED